MLQYIGQREVKLKDWQILSLDFIYGNHSGRWHVQQEDAAVQRCGKFPVVLVFTPKKDTSAPNAEYRTAPSRGFYLDIAALQNWLWFTGYKQMQRKGMLNVWKDGTIFYLCTVGPRKCGEKTQIWWIFTEGGGIPDLLPVPGFFFVSLWQILYFPLLQVLQHLTNGAKQTFLCTGILYSTIWKSCSLKEPAFCCKIFLHTTQHFLTTLLHCLPIFRLIFRNFRNTITTIKDRR